MTFIATRRATQSRLWTPRDISVNLSAWYDGQDISTYTFNGSSVSRWADKSGLGNHLIQGTTAAQPGFNSNSVQFVNNNQFLSTSGNANIPISNTPRTVFYVYSTFSGRSTDSFVLQWGSGSGSTWWINYVHTATNGTGIDPIAYAGGFYTSAIGAVYNSTQVVSCSASLASLIVNINGASAITASSLSFATAAAPLYIARNSDGTRPWNGVLFEAIILNVALPPSLVQTVEGYLAWKWGTQGLLPSSHPYKLYRPRVAA